MDNQRRLALSFLLALAGVGLPLGEASAGTIRGYVVKDAKGDELMHAVRAAAIKDRCCRE